MLRSLPAYVVLALGFSLGWLSAALVGLATLGFVGLFGPENVAPSSWRAFAVGVPIWSFGVVGFNVAILVVHLIYRSRRTSHS
jgi:hypothetical protein